MLSTRQPSASSSLTSAMSSSSRTVTCFNWREFRIAGIDRSASACLTCRPPAMPQLQLSHVIRVDLRPLQAAAVVHVDRLPLGEDLERGLAGLAVAVAGAAGAAERELDLGADRAGIDVHDARGQVTDRLERGVDVRGEDRAGQAVGGLVVDPDRLLPDRSASMMLSTGPKISSCAIRISAARRRKSSACRSCPSPGRRLRPTSPPVASTCALRPGRCSTYS